MPFFGFVQDMAYWRVRFLPSEGAEASARAWVTRFDHHTQRGGG
jgi:hypothetical protein